MKRAIRILLTGALIVGVYSETGPWTTVTVVLIMLSLEALLYLHQEGES